MINTNKVKYSTLTGLFFFFMSIINFSMITKGDILFNPIIYILPIVMGCIAGFIYGHFIDNLEKKVKYKTKEIQKSQKLFKDLLTSSPNLIMIHDKNHKLKYSNYKYIENLDRTIRDNPFCKNTHTKEHPCNIMSVFQDKIERKFETSDLVEGKVFDYAVFPIIDSNEDVEHVVTIAMDITDKKKYEKELEKLSNIDPLTEIYNRRKFNEEYEKEWKAALRDNECITIIMGDVDFFKQYNDFYGHVNGDEVIKSISSTILNNIKRSKDILARYGGEEFIIMLPKTDIKGGLYLAEKLKENIEKLNIEHEKSSFGKITMSFGVCSVKVNHDIYMTKVVKTADNALYNAKRSGRNKVESLDLN